MSHASAYAGLVLPVLTGLFAATYGVARRGYVLFYQPLGLTPEDLGLSEVVIVSEAGMLFGLLVVYLSGVLAAGFVMYQLTTTARARWRRREFSWREQWRRCLVSALLIAFPLLAATVAGITGTGRLPLVMLALGAGLWSAATTPRPAARVSIAAWGAIGFAIPGSVLVLAPLVSMPPMRAGVTFLVLTVSVALGSAARYEGPLGDRLYATLLPASAVIGLALAAGAAAGTAREWLALALPPVGLAISLAAMSWRELSEMGQDLLFTTRAVALGLVTTILLGFAAVALSDFFKGAARDGEDLLALGKLPDSSNGLFASRVSGAHILSLGDDPLRVCSEPSSALLLGRVEAGAYVLLRGAAEFTRVVLLPTDDYSVSTAVGTANAGAMPVTQGARSCEATSSAGSG